jgi:hypothetical protein
MNKNKYRFWCYSVKDFVQNYKYNGFVNELFDQEDVFLIPQQSIRILDCNMKEIYEGDVVKFTYSSNESKLGVVIYMNDYCAYAIQYDNGYVPIMNVAIDSLEIVGNIMKDYIWNENGELIKNENRNS